MRQCFAQFVVAPGRKETRKIYGGVLTATIGPCRMQVEEFLCSSSSCNAKVTSEGRDQFILMDKVTSAATHALLRRELHGVVVSNGTLSGRLSHFHSLVTANAYFGIIPEEPSCRSVKTLIRLCSIMLRLMCTSPPTHLFRCDTCEHNGGPHRRN